MLQAVHALRSSSTAGHAIQAGALIVLMMLCDISSARQSQPQPPAEPSLLLEQALPQDAFKALGDRYSAEFRLIEGQEWIGPEAGVRVSADLREVSFWQAVLAISQQTSYELVFKPYGRNEHGQPVLWLRRVDVRSEAQVRPAVASGPLLVRSSEAFVTVTIPMAQVRLVPPQAAVRVEVFLEPHVPAVYVTAAALRAVDEKGEALRRGEGHDPTVGMDNGVGEMLLYFDAVRRVPTDIARWQGLLRVVSALRSEDLVAPVTVLPEERSHGVVAKPASTDPAPAAITRPARAAAAASKPATTQAMAGTPHDLGPYRMYLQPVLVGVREPSEEETVGQAQPRRIATMGLVVPRGALDHGAWSRLYGFLISLPPSLVQDRSGGNAEPWRLTGYAVVSTPSADEPEVAGTFRVWAQYEAAAGSPDPKWLKWELPTESAEQRFPIAWEKSLPIAAPAQPVPQKQARPNVPGN